MSAKRRPKKRQTAPPSAAKKPLKPAEPKNPKNGGGATTFQAEKTENNGGSATFQAKNNGGATTTFQAENNGGAATAFQAEKTENNGGSATSPSTRPSRPAKSTPGVSFRFFDAFAVGASRLKTPISVSKIFNAFFRASARLVDVPSRPKTPRQEADDRQARFVAGVAALAFAVGVVFFFAGKASRRLDPPPRPGAATIPTPKKLADAVAAEVAKERSNAIRRRAVLETSVKTAANVAVSNDVNDKIDFNAARVNQSGAKTDSFAAHVDAAPSAATLAFVVELNAASKSELTNLPRVGEKLAERIIERREELGGFRSVDDLLGVKGIGEKTLDKMRPYCVVAPPDAAE